MLSGILGFIIALSGGLAIGYFLGQVWPWSRSVGLMAGVVVGGVLGALAFLLLALVPIALPIGNPVLWVVASGLGVYASIQTKPAPRRAPQGPAGEAKRRKGPDLRVAASNERPPAASTDAPPSTPRVPKKRPNGKLH